MPILKFLFIGQRTVPAELTIAISPHLVAMKGTEKSPARCIALQGEVGKNVFCSIYTNRASTCREFKFSGDEGVLNPDCDKARQKYNLPSYQ